MSKHYDYIAIGGGSGGIASVNRAASYGKKCALIEAGDLGGTCVNVGCVPKKVMWYSAQIADAIQKYGSDYGFNSELKSFDWKKLVENRQAYIQRIHASYQSGLSKNQVDVIHGFATFVDHKTIEVNGETFTADHILIATGTQPSRPNIEGAEYGIDYQLLNAAKQVHKPIIELEGASSQIELLCQLPDNGLALLDDTLTHWHTNARLLQQMMGWWLKTPPRNSELTLPNTFSQSLYDVLMHQRNVAWRDRLRAMPAGHYVVAVGALHLYGEGNLPEMLR